MRRSAPVPHPLAGEGDREAVEGASGSTGAYRSKMPISRGRTNTDPAAFGRTSGTR